MNAPQVSITLTEWESRFPEPGTQLFGLALEDDAEVRALASRLSGARMLGISELRSGLRLEASSYVGRVELGHLQITVRPKIKGGSLLRLLRYAYGLRDLDLFSPVDYDAEAGAFQDLLIRQLATEAQQLLSRGLHREYVSIDEDLSSPRGKIDTQRIVNRGGLMEAALPCTHHARLEDHLTNQVLLEGLYLGARLTDDLSLKARLRRLAGMLRESVSTIRLNTETLRRLRRADNRLTAAYRPATTIIEILLESQGISLDDSRPDVKLPGFLFDMNLFFQTLLSKFLNEYLRGYTVRDQRQLKDTMAYVPGYNPKSLPAPKPRPDYVITRGPKVVAILDAKYRDLWEKSLPSEMLYQLAVYALTQPSVHTATILYPAVGRQAREARIEVRDPLYGEGHAQVVLRPVDLLLLERLLFGTTNGEKHKILEGFAYELAFGQDSLGADISPDGKSQ